MAKAGQRKCMSCGEFFIPDHRSGERQRFCCAAACRRASKAASQASWLAKPPNHDYFSGPVRISANVTGDFGNVTDLGLGAGLRG